VCLADELECRLPMLAFNQSLDLKQSDGDLVFKPQHLAVADFQLRVRGNISGDVDCPLRDRSLIHPITPAMNKRIPAVQDAVVSVIPMASITLPPCVP